MRTIGFLNAGALHGYERSYAAFLDGLRRTGFVEGSNVRIETRWAEGNYARLPIFLAEFVDRHVDVIAATSTPGALAGKAHVTATPVVFTTSGNPIQLGIVGSLSRPDGNFTGASQLNVEVSPKRLELALELLPAARRIGLLVNPDNPAGEAVRRELSAAADARGVSLQVVKASHDHELDAAFAALAAEKADVLVIGTDTFYNSQSELLADLAIRHHLPTIYQYPEFTAAGGLISYGGTITESYRMAGSYVGRILRGEKPGNLPVQQVVRIELIINLKTARRLGLNLPWSILSRADEVVE
jgi:putative ABC transport system substrate-binding protein